MVGKGGRAMSEGKGLLEMPPIETVNVRRSRPMYITTFGDMGAMVAELDQQVLLATMMPPALMMGMDSVQPCPCQDCQERERRAELHAMVKARFDAWMSSKGGEGR